MVCLCSIHLYCLSFMRTNRFFIHSAYILFISSISYWLEISKPKLDFIQHMQETGKEKKVKVHPEISLPGFLMASAHNWKTTHFSGEGKNKPPVVKILSPENNTSVEPDALIRYAISVSDEEDGKSEFQEIASQEVFLEITYQPDSSKAADHLATHSKNVAEPPGLTLIKTSDCFNCHAIKNKGQGPPFAEIAKRYPDNPTTIETLAMRVINGNTGIWGNAAMPPHAGITEQQARHIIQWILKNAGDPNHDLYAGIEGSFRTRAQSQVGGLYILTATYLDHGLKEMPQLRQSGRHTIVLKGK